MNEKALHKCDHVYNCHVWLATLSIMHLCICLPFNCVQYGRTALWLGCYKGHVEVAQLLLQKGADVSIHNKVCILYIQSAVKLLACDGVHV